MASYHRAVGWSAFVVLGLFRPGIDTADRWLISTCWSIPSQWNAVADAAIVTGVVDRTLGGEPAPWRQASIQTIGSLRIAVVTVSDMRRSRVTFLTEDYQVLGGFERITAEATLVSDEARGYKPLSHVWPLDVRDGQLHTLVAFEHLLSEEPHRGVFAYVAVAADRNELLFVADLREGPTWGVLSRLDFDGDGDEDLVFYSRGERDQPPLATFIWDARARTYLPSVLQEARPLIRWWSTTAAARVTFAGDEVLDDVVRRVTLLDPSTGG